jgi:hypothetical protein
VIHPFAIIELQKFLEYQQMLNMFVSGDYALTLSEAFKKWLSVYSQIPLIQLSFFLLPLSLILGLTYYLKFRKLQHLLYIVNLVGIILISGMICFGNRLFVEDCYIQPIYPFLIINVLSVILFIKNIDLKRLAIVRSVSLIFFAYFVILSLSKSIYTNVPKIVDRIYYQNSIAYLSYEYIIQNILPSDKIAYDSHVAFPEAIKNQGCHYWRECGTDYIYDYKPNYVMFYEDYIVNGKKFAGTERFKKYIKENNLTLIKKIDGIVDDKKITISVYKKL